jgi:hypothetical protein
VLVRSACSNHSAQRMKSGLEPAHRRTECSGAVAWLLAELALELLAQRRRRVSEYCADDVEVLERPRDDDRGSLAVVHVVGDDRAACHELGGDDWVRNVPVGVIVVARPGDVRSLGVGGPLDRHRHDQ